MTQYTKNLRENLQGSIYKGFLLFSVAFSYLCKKNKNRIISKIIKKKEMQPWMRYKEIIIMKELLTKLQPKRCLEWGTGYSTLYFPKYLPGNFKWISIEHDEEWVIKIRELNERSNVQIYHQHPNHFPWTDKNKDGSYSDLKEYINFPNKFGKFDFILIDGRARDECLKKAYDLVEHKGLVILHDANRNYYHGSLNLFRYQALFVDLRDGEGGLWIGSKGSQIKTVLDVHKHKTLWHLIEKYSNNWFGRGLAKEI